MGDLTPGRIEPLGSEPQSSDTPRRERPAPPKPPQSPAPPPIESESEDPHQLDELA